MKIALNVVKILAIGIFLFGLYVSKYRLWPQYFEIEWKEEVLLHDGRILIVDMKKQYERHGYRMFQFENVTFSHNTAKFDDPVYGVITIHTRLGISYIDRFNGEWYITLRGDGPYGNYPEEMPNHWGNDFATSNDRLAKFDGTKFIPIRWEDAPPGEILKSNRIEATVTAEILNAFNGKTMSISDKEKLKTLYPPGPGGNSITRPLRMTQTKEIQ